MQWHPFGIRSPLMVSSMVSPSGGVSCVKNVDAGLCSGAERLPGARFEVRSATLEFRREGCPGQVVRISAVGGG